MKPILILTTLSLFSGSALAAGPGADASNSFPAALAEAKRLVETDAGKVYDNEFAAAVSSRLGDVVGLCAKDSKLPIIFDVVFVFAADGHVDRVFQTPDQPAAVCVADKLRDVRLSAPPHVGWPVQLHVDLRSRNAEATNPGGSQSNGPVPNKSVTADAEDMNLTMKAGQAEAAGKYDEALVLYAQAIKLKGHFATFAYQNRGMLFLHRAKRSTENRVSRIADLQRAIADFKTSIALGVASDDELNRGLEKIATKANLEEATKLLEQETKR